ncbi:hypothetical protein OAP63_16645 [Vibrio sp.]|uniref:Thymidylate kinase n=1 Tax=Vibrio viridaestus TaxID=2487322 RepID=A0A3N9TAE4_9VIBR|nr:hypothetical protein [Vibrio viridaestus]MDC0612360.1 hypothetical protein [Vibrio sp.]RQW61058.1 hypothetical protein EES38_21305 [Vibrio viridaestus]
MTIEELQSLYKGNLLVEAIIEPFSEEGKWIVEFKHAQGGFVVMTDPHGEECHYNDVGHASRSAMEVGFKQVRIES